MLCAPTIAPFVRQSDGSSAAPAVSRLDAAERAALLRALTGDVAELAAVVALRAGALLRALRRDVAELATVVALRAAPAALRALGGLVHRLRAVPGQVSAAARHAP
eukprot:SAG22_NODE_9320_length_596_cov_1.140845_2_plen_106_part_00